MQDTLATSRSVSHGKPSDISEKFDLKLKFNNTCKLLSLQLQETYK